MMHGGNMWGGFGGYGQFGGGTPFGGYPNVGWMPGFDFSWLLLLALIAILAVWFFKKKGSPSLVALQESKTPSLQAEEVAKLRYARGEITFEEYQAIVKTINS